VHFQCTSTDPYITTVCCHAEHAEKQTRVLQGLLTRADSFDLAQ
jgi:hypothetical protein